MLEPVEMTDFFADGASEPPQEFSLHVFGICKDSKLLQRPLSDGDERQPCSGMPSGGSQLNSRGLLCSLLRLGLENPARSKGVNRLEGGLEPAITEEVGREPGLNGATQSRLTCAGAVPFPRHGSENFMSSRDCCEAGAGAIVSVQVCRTRKEYR